MKKNKRLHGYITFLLILCILLGLLLRGAADFWLGFFAGFNEMANMEDARAKFGAISQVLGWASIFATVVSISIGCYKRLRRTVTKPIEQLAGSMRQVSAGNLSVRSPENGDYEIASIQKTFNSMVEELETAKKTKEITEQKNLQLYAGIAHDLKTPMTMILGYAKLLEQGTAVSEEDKVRYLQTIIEQTEHTNKLLDSLLAYTKLENPSYQLKKEKQDLAECLRECVANLYPMLEEAQVRLELLLPEQAIPFEFDQVEMKRVFTNLLTNMVKHNPSNTSCVVQLEDQPGQGIIQITVADNGPKIPKDLQDTIFDTFVVGDASRNTKQGSGLGLSVSKRIIQRHGGSLYYTDEWKPGYKSFQITLPTNCINTGEIE